MEVLKMSDHKRFEHSQTTSFVITQSKWSYYVELIRNANLQGEKLVIHVFVGGYLRKIIGTCLLFNESLNTFLCNDIVIRADEIVSVEWLEEVESDDTAKL